MSRRKGKRAKLTNTGDGVYDGCHGYSHVTDPRSGQNAEGYPEELTQIYQYALSGPDLSCLRETPGRMGCVLEARVRNRRGVLPTCLTPPGKTRLIEQKDGMWFKDVICRLTRIQNKQGEQRPRYLVRFFLKTSQGHTESDQGSGIIKSDDGELGVSLGDVPCQADRDGVRGHARGLVTSRMIDRLDGTGCSRLHLTLEDLEVELITGTRVEIRMRKSACAKLFEEPTDCSPAPHQGIQADCLQALMRRVFHKAKTLDDQLLHWAGGGSVCAAIKVGPMSGGGGDAHLQESEPAPRGMSGEESVSCSDRNYAGALHEKYDRQSDLSVSEVLAPISSGRLNTQSEGLDESDKARIITRDEIPAIDTVCLHFEEVDDLDQDKAPKYQQVLVAGNKMSGKHHAHDRKPGPTSSSDQPSDINKDRSESQVATSRANVTKGHDHSSSTARIRDQTKDTGKTYPKWSSPETEALLKTAKKAPKVNTEYGKLLNKPQQTKPELTKQVGSFVVGFLCCVPALMRRQNSAE